MNSASVIKGHFVPVTSGRLFVTQFGSARADKTILVLPSIFEEMNLSRAVIAKQAQYLTQFGYCLYVMDYFGTGDSEGEMEAATVNIWQQDIVDVVKWLKVQEVDSITLWAIRFGALLSMSSMETVVELMRETHAVLWKPVIKGKLFASQFLRVKHAQSMMKSDDKTNWRQEIKDGKLVEISGYVITERLLASIETLNLPATLPKTLKVSWLELASKNVSLAVKAAVAEWPEEHLKIDCDGNVAFWQIPEVFDQAHLHERMRTMLELGY